MQHCACNRVLWPRSFDWRLIILHRRFPPKLKLPTRRTYIGIKFPVNHINNYLSPIEHIIFFFQFQLSGKRLWKRGSTACRESWAKDCNNIFGQLDLDSVVLCASGWSRQVRHRNADGEISLRHSLSFINLLLLLVASLRYSKGRVTFSVMITAKYWTWLREVDRWQGREEGRGGRK